MSENSRKDFWDKLDAMSKFFSGVLLAVIALMIKLGSDKISHTNERSQLVKQLISDLTATDAHVRQDIALLALDNYIGNDDPAMVAGIAERIFLEVNKTDTLHQSSYEPTTLVAYKILQKRDSIRANTLITDLQKKVVDARANKDTLHMTKVLQSDISNLVAQVLKKVVYIQYVNPGKKKIAQDIQALCLKKKWAAPGTTESKENAPNAVKYFHEEDAAFAQKVADVATGYFNGAKKFPLHNLSGVYPDIRSGQLELWIGE